MLAEICTLAPALSADWHATDDAALRRYSYFCIQCRYLHRHFDRRAARAVDITHDTHSTRRACNQMTAAVGRAPRFQASMNDAGVASLRRLKADGPPYSHYQLVTINAPERRIFTMATIAAAVVKTTNDGPSESRDEYRWQ